MAVRSQGMNAPPPPLSPCMHAKRRGARQCQWGRQVRLKTSVRARTDLANNTRHTANQCCFYTTEFILNTCHREKEGLWACGKVDDIQLGRQRTGQGGVARISGAQTAPRVQERDPSAERWRIIHGGGPKDHACDDPVCDKHLPVWFSTTDCATCSTDFVLQSVVGTVFAISKIIILKTRQEIWTSENPHTKLQTFGFPKWNFSVKRRSNGIADWDWSVLRSSYGFHCS